MHSLPAEVENPLWQRPPKGGLAPRAGEVHLWRAQIPLSPSAALHATVSEAELRYAERMTSDTAQRQFVAAQAALRTALALYLEEPPARLQFFRGEHGKPFLERSHDSDLQFNLSHSHDLALVAVTAGSEIGVDLEKVRERSAAARLSARFFADHERAAFDSAPTGEKERVFFRLWTRKESHLKATGTGLSVNLKAIDTLDGGDEWWYHEFAPHPEYSAAVAGAGERPRLSYYDLELPE